MTSPNSYSVLDARAHRVVDVSDMDAADLVRYAGDVVTVLETARRAAGPGSAVTSALADLEALHDDAVRANQVLCSTAFAQTRVAIDTYIAADQGMAKVYGPFAPKLTIPPPFRPVPPR